MRVSRGRIALERAEGQRVRLTVDDAPHSLTLDELRWLAVVAAPTFLASPSPRTIGDDQPPDQTALPLG